MLVECLANNKFFETLSTAELFFAQLKPEFTPESPSRLFEFFMRFKSSPSVVSSQGSGELKNIFLQELQDADFGKMAELHKLIKETRTAVPDVDFEFLKSYIKTHFAVSEDLKSSKSNLALLTVNHRYQISVK